MQNLWKRESDESAYVDIFATIPDDVTEPAIRWVQQSVLYDSRKSDSRSAVFRMKGNDAFGLEDWTRAMNHYNESLAYAEIGSENEALAYSNRSACFFKMKLYEKVLVDIELAMNSKIPDRLMKKMLGRKQKSIELLQTDTPTAKPDLKLDFKPNEKYPCLADVMDLRHSTEFGRHMIANQDIPIGKIIMREKNFVGFTGDDVSKCHTCFSECVNFIACKQCPSALFCNEDCMNHNSTHNWICPTGFNDLPNGLEHEAQIVLMALETFKTVDNLMQFVERVLREDPGEMPTTNDEMSKYHFFFKLNKCAPELAEENFISNYLTYVILLNLPKVSAVFDNEEKRRFLMHLVIHHYSILANNGFSNPNKSDNSLFINLAMFNHSCNPNLVVFPPENRVTSCATIRPVKKGDQLFISYLKQNIPGYSQHERQEMLQSGWNFVCTCDLCELGYESSSDSLWLDQNIEFAIKHQKDATKFDQVLTHIELFLIKHGHVTCSDVVRTAACKYGNMILNKLT